MQDFLAPEIRTHGVKLDSLHKRLEDTKKSLEQRIEDSKSSLQHQITDTKETLRAEMRKLQSRFEILEVRFGSLEELIRASMRQIGSNGALRERVALLEARMPKQ